MNRRRISLYALIVTAGMGIVVTPYLLPEPGRDRPDHDYSLAQCTAFSVVPDPGSPHGGTGPDACWLASITISNVGPRRAGFLPAEIVSRVRTGTENWPVTMPGVVLSPGASTAVTFRLPMTGKDPEGPRIWQFRGQYQARDNTAKEWLRTLQDHLPPTLELLDLPGIFQAGLEGEFPANAGSMLTNELRWRKTVINVRMHDGANKVTTVLLPGSDTAGREMPPNGR